MFTTAIAWMFGTKLGRTVTMAGALLLGVLLAWWAFASHYDEKGYLRCQGEHAAALAKANEEQARKNAANDKTSAAIGQSATKAGAAVVKAADAGNTKAKEIMTDVYKKPPVTAPVAPGSCVHPVDKRVQDRIDAAVRRANTAGG